MANRSSILSRSKKAENRVARYLFGDAACRDWKEDHDLSGPDADGRRWIGEVKNYTWPTGPGRLWSFLCNAFAQAEGYGDRVFAILIPTHCQPQDALVMYRAQGVPVVVTAAQFKAEVLGLAEEECENAS